MVSRTLSVGIFLMAGVSLSFVEVAAVHAQGEAPGGEAVRQRLDRVQAILDERADRARFWQYGWMGLGYAVTAGFAAGSAITNDKTNRLDFAFAAEQAVGLPDLCRPPGDVQGEGPAQSQRRAFDRLFKK